MSESVMASKYVPAQIIKNSRPVVLSLGSASKCDVQLRQSVE